MERKTCNKIIPSNTFLFADGELLPAVLLYNVYKPSSSADCHKLCISDKLRQYEKCPIRLKLFFQFQIINQPLNLIKFCFTGIVVSQCL